MTLSEFSLNGKVALVTGAGRGLGLEIAKLLAKAGACVIINGRNLERLNQAVAIIESIGGSISSLPFDVTDEVTVQKAFVEIQEKHGCLDILINNFGMRDRRGFFEFEMDAVRRLINADLIVEKSNFSRSLGKSTLRGGAVGGGVLCVFIKNWYYFKNITITCNGLGRLHQ
ncbi:MULTISPECIES: SDR family NAD(P)-dependent oxidoreductase [Nostoc]|uniref:SDR family NAD(P)-dependent oxidoreductase n=1 Tax=Nostoc paludosum FACHB-159 TaxID=2692908 RepID=A0ABR8K097_9NOSO|nr:MULTISPECIES: SDR family NAD(P)-dependent oxidoreductase [Nostoc]MBD2676557.1 SDR family NAD(P)-dependent oxidoreductase [Nostoc sp. FACHB-857]MBD2732309.1 SDR family NAD(P)-dependent oxidoreductase [Nostoc paludosum FACHB-159]